MRGTILTIAVDGIISKKEAAAPSLALLKEGIGGGHIELVPYFDTIEFEGELYRCRAFVDENGKNLGMKINARANVLWQEAQKRHARLGLLDDYLVGQVCVVWGDAAWMRAL